jgi:hypothetical protein
MARGYVRRGAIAPTPISALAAAASAVCLALILSACGGSESQSGVPSRSAEAGQVTEVLNTLRAFYRAGLNRDSATSCSLMSRRFVVGMSESAGGQSCQGALDELFLNFNPKTEAEQRQVIKALSPASVFLTGNTASLEVAGESADLVREGGKWLISWTHPDNARELTVFSAAQLEVELKDYFESGGNIMTVKKAICPPTEPVRVGHVFDCLLEFGAGSKALVSIKVRDLRGDYRISRPRSLIPSD